MTKAQIAKIATLDIPFEAFQQRLRTKELATPHLNDENRRLFSLPSQLVVREAFLADRSLYVDERTWNALRINRRLER